MRDGGSFSSFVALSKRLEGKIFVNIPLRDGMLLFSKRNEIKEDECVFKALCGKAIRDESGIWYYVLSKRENEGLLFDLYGVDFGLFDKDKLFLNSKNRKFSEIYYS
jgi:hypothetical protein